MGAVAIAIAGCAAANNATSTQASAQGEQPYKTMYGLSSEGTTTDLYTELFGSRQPSPAPATNVASAQPVQPVTPQSIGPVQQGQPYSTTQQYPVPTRQGQAATTTTAPQPYPAQSTTTASRSPQPGYAQPAAVQPVQTAQQPAPPPAPPAPDVPTAYGITANGPTTDLYTMIFGPRRTEGQ